MKQIISLLFSLTLTLSFASQTFCNDNEYFRGCFYTTFSVPTIDALQKIKSTGSYALLKVAQSFDNNAHSKKIAFIESQFKTIENDLRQQEKKAITKLLQTYTANDHVIAFYFHILNELKQYGREYMSKPRADVYHDNQTIPAPLYTTIIKHLKQNGIHPDSICISDLMKDEYKDVPFDAAAMASYHTWHIDGSQVVIHTEKPYRYGTIRLYPNVMIGTSDDDREAIIAHECQHLKEQHSAIFGSLKHYLSVLSENYNDKQLLDSKEWKNLKIIHELQANVFAALSNPITASQVRNVSAAYPYAGMLYESHYNQISKIDELWKYHTWLSSQSQQNTQA